MTLIRRQTGTDFAILGASPQGVELARRLRKGLGAGSLVDATEATTKTLQKSFGHGRTLVCVMPLETVVRALGPTLLSPTPRPGVIVVDEAGKFVIEVLAGSSGDVPALMARIAAQLGATAVSTRRDPVSQIPAAELIGRGWGWKIERQENLPRVVEVTRDQPVAVFQDAGRGDWWKAFGPWPEHFERLAAWPAERRWKALLAISDRLLPTPPAGLEQHMVVYRPPTLTLGITCPPGTRVEEIEEAVKELFVRHWLSLASLTALASSLAMKEEESLIEFAERYAIPHLAYPPEKLSLLQPKMHGGNGSAGDDCEPAAMLAAGVRELLIPRIALGPITMAVARRPFA